MEHTKKITLGFVLSWIFAVLFGVPGIMMLFEGKVLGGLLFILSALILLPPANTWAAKNIGFSLSGMLKFAVVIVLLIISGVVLSGDKTPVQSTTPTASNVTTTNPQSVTQNTPVSQAPTALKVSATQLSQTYANNEVAADAKYKGNVVDVTGVIETIGKDILNNPYVSLKTAEYSIISVQCMFSQADETKLATLSSGQSITLEGTVSGKIINVILDGCSVVK